MNQPDRIDYPDVPAPHSQGHYPGDYSYGYSQGSGSGSSIDPKHLFFLILKKLWIISLVVLLGEIAVASKVLNMPTLYKSTGVLQVEQREEKVLKTENVSGDSVGSVEYLNTVLQAISSRPILLSVVRSEHLEKNPKFNPGGALSDDQIAAQLSRQVEAHLRRGTRLVDISATDQDPSTACLLASSVIKQFLKEADRQRTSVSRSANEFLSDEAEKLKEKLKASENALQHYKEIHDAISLQDNQNLIVEKLHHLSTEVNAAQDRKFKIEADLEQFRRTDPSKTEELLKIQSVADAPRVAGLTQQITQANADFTAIKERYLERHPKFIAARNRIKALEQSRAEAASSAGDEITRQYTDASDTLTKLEGSLKAQESKSMELDKLAIEYNVLRRDVESDTALYSSVVSRMKETGVSAESENSPFRIVEEPLPGAEIPTNGPLIIAGAFVFLFIFSAGVIILQDMLGSSIRSVDLAESLLGLPVLGCIPELRHKGDNLFIPVVDRPSSAMAESFRTLRAGILLHDPDKSLKGLTLITSAIPEEGKSTTALNMAACFAQLGDKTLLLDADLRRPTLYKLFSQDHGKTHGLSDVLAGKCTPEDAIHETEIPNLFAMTAGTTSKNPAELLSSSATATLFNHLKTNFAHLIVDTAPVNAVGDTLTLTHLVDRVCVVIRSGKTPRKAVQRCIQMIRKSGVQITGTILNRLHRSGAGYYYYYYAGKYGKKNGYVGSGSSKPESDNTLGPS
jgi:capsular exopolysaccharide synthesis family protein